MIETERLKMRKLTQDDLPWLIEMRSEEYLAMPHGRPDSTASGDTTGLVET